jgi:ribosomal-protein-alanine N-acetyltransferase
VPKQVAPYLPELTTNRLLLRGLELHDAEKLAAIRSDPAVNKYLMRASSITLIESVAFIKNIIKSVKDRKSYYWGITVKDSDELIGAICLWNINRRRKEADLGYELEPSMQGKGIMTEAVDTVVAFAFEELNFKTIIAVTNRFNEPSLSLLKKFGFKDYQAGDDLGADEIALARRKG